MIMFTIVEEDFQLHCNSWLSIRISFRREIEVGFEIEAKVECVAEKFATDACEASALIASSDFAYIHPNTS